MDNFNKVYPTLLVQAVNPKFDNVVCLKFKHTTLSELMNTLTAMGLRVKTIRTHNRKFIPFET